MLREQLIKIYNLPAEASDQDIVAAGADAQEYNVTIKAKIAQQEAEEVIIAKKMKVGLTRDQAVSVIQRQKDHDAAIAKQWGERRPKIIEILKEGLKEREMRAHVREFNAAITTDEINAAKEAFQNADLSKIPAGLTTATEIAPGGGAPNPARDATEQLQQA